MTQDMARQQRADRKKAIIARIDAQMKPPGLRRRGAKWTRLLGDRFLLTLTLSASSFAEEYGLEVDICVNDDPGRYCYDAVFNRKCGHGHRFDWQTAPAEQADAYIRDAAAWVRYLISTPLHELGHDPALWAWCSCTRQKCESCWLQRNCWEAKPVIHVFGASGSGTTTLGHALAKRLSLRHMDTDDYFWLPTDPPFTQKRPIPERLNRMLSDITCSSGAVISGSLVDWGDPLTAHFTLAVRVVTDQTLRLERLHARELARFGPRILPGGDMADAHQAFLAWAAQYDDGDVTMRSRAKHDLWQQGLACPVMIVDGRLPVDQLAEQVLDGMRRDYQRVNAPRMQEVLIDRRKVYDRLFPRQEDQNP